MLALVDMAREKSQDSNSNAGKSEEPQIVLIFGTARERFQRSNPGFRLGKEKRNHRLHRLTQIRIEGKSLGHEFEWKRKIPGLSKVNFRRDTLSGDTHRSTRPGNSMPVIPVSLP